MQPNPQFVEPLIALKRYYQSLLDQGERYLADAREKLTHHANTLLFEQKVDDQGVIESLIAMRQQWRKISSDCSSKIDHAREQLTHVNALLADQMVMQLPELPVSMETLTVNENKNLGLADTPDIKSDFSPKEPGGVAHSLALDEASKASSASVSSVPPTKNSDILVKPLTQPTFERRDINANEGLTKMSGFIVTAPIVTVQPEPEFNISLDDEPKDQPEPLIGLITVAPLMQPDSITKSDAIAKDQPSNNQLLTLTVPPNLQAVENLLSEKAGAILHRDYLLRVLCGELEPDDLEVETATLSEILTIGVNQGLWAEVPDEKDCYTLDLRLVDPELAAKARLQKPSGKPPTKNSDILAAHLFQSTLGRRDINVDEEPDIMSGFVVTPKSLPRRKLALLPLPNYQHLSLTDAIERVLMENAPQPLNIDTVTQKLFGSRESTARKSVGDLLVKGVIKGRWQRVPGRGAARYNISLKSQPGDRD